MAIEDIDTQHIEQAIMECDRIGHDKFIEKYGYGKARGYNLVKNGREYASKAILGVAHKFITPSSKPLKFNDFGGGKADAAKRLQKLGFEVSQPARNPPWSRDELILALDLYFTNPTNPPGKGSKAVDDLSALLNKLQRLNGTTGNASLRNQNGVYLKMMNLRALDSNFTSQGKVGMQSGGLLEKTIWQEYKNKRAKLAQDAGAIRAAITVADVAAPTDVSSRDPYEGDEGGIIMRLHRRYERDARLIVEKKKDARLKGLLVCEICDFDFEKRYGTLGADFIEVHHTKPVHAMKPGSKTKLSDLALLCSNCHRMAHRKRLPLSIAEVKAAIST
ncbi:MAG: HNH endonuclease [Beijerinckiaceae bacterium]|nr:HNH endonuclease [Beijerinckiaceae bacterium]